MPHFDRYIGVDYSGAETANARLTGLRIYMAGRDAIAGEVPPPSHKYWSRRQIAEWLVERLEEPPATLVGIDHGFSFPWRYFEQRRLPPDWPNFLHDFQIHWPTDRDNVYVDFVREGVVGNGAARSGDSRWRRLCDERAGAKSVFHFDVPGSVAKSTHAGLPWLRFIRNRLGDRIHFWPFDGWDIPEGRSALAEIYPRVWNRTFPREGRTPDQHDAYSVARGLAKADHEGVLADMLNPALTEDERDQASLEGWILGVSGVTG